MSRGPRSIREVAEKHLCTGCGVCAYLQPDDVRMVDDIERGRRPVQRGDADTGEALRACPGVGLEHGDLPAGVVGKLVDGWGPVLELWEGYAADEEVRWLASSGGAATALVLGALERGEIHGVLHITARPDVPYLNHTVLSHTREELLAATGSRYAPASPCDGLALVEAAPGPCAFIGKPCDVAAVRRAMALRPALAEKIAWTVAVFCAGTPSTRGTLEMLAVMGVDPADLERLRYRGKGWPGHAEAQAGERVARLTYDQSWGKILQRHRQWRCYVCLDHTGEFADIAVGDPWYREIPPDEPGRSLVLARTERGRSAIRAAMQSGHLELEEVEPRILPDSQPNLLRTRGSVWGRILTCRAFGVAAPRYRRMPSARWWWRALSWRERISAFYGTAKRVFTKRLYRRRPVVEHSPEGARRA